MNIVKLIIGIGLLIFAIGALIAVAQMTITWITVAIAGIIHGIKWTIGKVRGVFIHSV